MKKSFFVSSFATLLLVLTSAWASAADYKFDKVHTQITFTVSHLGFSYSTGSFVDFDGSFSFDQNDFSTAKVNVTIDVNSIDMNDDTWNDHMTGPKWFNAEKFPTMEFVSKSVTKTGDKTMDVLGDLTIRGITKPATLAVTFNKAGQQFGKEKIGFSATTTINRTDFDITRAVPGIGVEIPVRIEVEGVKL